ncbi:MAG: TatD family hydrolase [bacterium]|nr:TatD family hydrolase [bacterium]
MYIDSHTHFDMILKEKNISEDSLMTGLIENNLKYVVQVAIDTKGFQWAYDFAKKYRKNGIFFSLGIHPSSWAADKELSFLSDFIKKVMTSEDSDLLFGVGECGLDYFRLRQEKEMQQKSFEHHIEEAKKWNLPLITHSREAMADTIAMFKNNNPGRILMHCFPGDSKAAKEILDLGGYISFAGNVTYKKAVELHDSAAYVPLDRLLVETDAPFLTPVPFRGKKNKPEYVINTYKYIADLRNEPLEKLVDEVHKNFVSLTKR